MCVPAQSARNQKAISQRLLACAAVAAGSTGGGSAGAGQRAAAKKAGRQLRPRTLLFAAWVLIWTTLPPAVLSTDPIAGALPGEWQVELVIRRVEIDIKY